MPRDYSKLFKRIQEEIPIEEINKETIGKFINSTKGNREVLVQEFLIANSITLTERFARERGITLSNKIKGKEYLKWGRYKKRAIVIRNSKGRIMKWGYV